MKKLFEIVKKFLLSRTFEQDGFVYEFMSILERDDSVFTGDIGFIVNVRLPNPKQSYCTEKFNEDILKFVENFQRYLGENFSYSLNLLVDGKADAPKLYINPEKQEELIERINEQIKKPTKYFKIRWYNYFYEMDQQNVMIHFNYDIFDSEFKVDNLNKKEFNKVVHKITELIYDTDDIRAGLEDICYEVLDGELKLSTLPDSYYEVTYNIKRIEGIKV